jgi:hypothetical protein
MIPLRDSAAHQLQHPGLFGGLDQVLNRPWSTKVAAVMIRGRSAHAVIAEARQMDNNLTVASFDAIVGQVPADLRQRVYAALRAAGLS